MNFVVNGYLSLLVQIKNMSDSDKWQARMAGTVYILLYIYIYIFISFFSTIAYFVNGNT